VRIRQLEESSENLGGVVPGIPRIFALIRHGMSLISNNYWAQFPKSRLTFLGFLPHWILLGVWKKGRILPMVTINLNWPSITATLGVRPSKSGPDRVPDFVLEEIYAQLEIEPALAASGNRAISNLRVIGGQDEYQKLGINWPGIEPLLSEGFSNVILVPHVVKGGADSYADSLIRHLDGRTLVITSLPYARATQSTLSHYKGFESATIVSIGQIVSRPGSEELIIARLFNAIRPKNIFVVNSELGYSVLARFGLGLSFQSSCFAVFFSTNPIVVAGQYGNRWVHKLPMAVKVITDNLPAREFLSEVRPNQVLYLPATVNVGKARWTSTASPRGRWLWLGRMDEFKGLDLLSQIAALRPEETFHVFGPRPQVKPSSLGLVEKNVHIKGEFEAFEDLPLSEYDGLVFTSRFEGFPLVVIEALASSIPIVSTDVGGIKAELGDLVQLIPWTGDQKGVARDFSFAMSDIQSRLPEDQEKRIEEMRKKYLSLFSDEKFAERLAGVIS